MRHVFWCLVLTATAIAQRVFPLRSSSARSRLVRLAALGCALSALLVTTPPGALASRGAAASSWFGTGVGADSLDNTPIGGPGHSVLAYRFLSTWTGTITSLRFYVITNPDGGGGYSDGSLGMLRVSLLSDAGGSRHLPGRHVLAHVDLKPSASQLFPRVRFPSPPRVRKGRYYDIVWTNVDPHPSQNWVSINSLLAHAAGVAAPPLAFRSAVFQGSAPDMARPHGWRLRSETARELHLPIIDIAGGDGQHAGLGFMESWIGNPKPIGDGNAVRELFTYTRSHAQRVVSALVRVRRTENGEAPLQVRLETPGGRVLAATQVDASKVPRGSAGWVAAHFSRPARLHHGQRVAFVLRSQAEDFQAFPLRDGSHFGFHAATVFASGYAEYDSGDGWGGWDMWDQSNRHDGDLQFSLHLAG